MSTTTQTTKKLIDNPDFEIHELELRNQALRHVLLVLQNSMTDNQRAELTDLYQQTSDRLQDDTDLTEEQTEILESLQFALENVLDNPRDQVSSMK